MVTPAQLAYFQQESNRWLQQTADILRFTKVDDGAGGIEQTWTAIATAVPCRVSPRQIRPYETTIDVQVVLLQQWYAVFPQGTDITELDRVVNAGRTFEVTAPLQARFLETMCRVNLMLVR